MLGGVGVGGKVVAAEGDGEGRQRQEGRNVEGVFLCLGRREGWVDMKVAGNGEGGSGGGGGAAEGDRRKGGQEGGGIGYVGPGWT